MTADLPRALQGRVGEGLSETSLFRLVLTELAIADPTNAGPATVRATGRLCYPAGPRAVRALDHLWRYRRWLDQRG